MRYFILLFLLSLSYFTHAQQITTLFDSTFVINDGLVTDQAGYIYGSHFTLNSPGAVYKIHPNGHASVFADSLNSPNGLAFDSHGDLYVVDFNDNKIYKFDPAGNASVVVPSISNPSGIVKDINSDTMYITQYYANTVQKLAPDNSVIPFLSGSPLNGPVGMGFANDGFLYIANFNDRKIYRALPNGTLQFLVQLPGATNDWLGFMTSINGELYATVVQLHKIYKIGIDGSITEIAGTTAGNADGDVSIAQFNRPNGITGSLSGDTIYVSDLNSGNVRMITDLTTSILSPEMSNGAFSAFPNPSRETVRITGNFGSKSKNFIVHVYNISGLLIDEISGTSNNGHINLKIDNRNWSLGTYLIEISSGEQRSTLKILKK